MLIRKFVALKPVPGIAFDVKTVEFNYIWKQASKHTHTYTFVLMDMIVLLMHKYKSMNDFYISLQAQSARLKLL